jgi:hypothetical protein
MSNKKNIKNNLINKKIDFYGIYNNNNEETIILNLDNIIDYHLKEGKFLNADGTVNDVKLLEKYQSEKKFRIYKSI